MSMREGVCTECGHREIYTRSGWFHNVVVAFMPPRTQIYVCGNCGYIAEFIQTGAHLEHVRKHWKRHETTLKRKNDSVT